MLGQENKAKTYVGFRRIAKPIKQCPKSVARTIHGYTIHASKP